LLQRLAPLVGAEADSTADCHELFTAWRLFLEELAAARPTVLVFEDLHWADEALLAFLEHVVEWSEGVPLLVLCAARPELYERRPGWGAGLRNAHTLNLSPLSEPETADLVAELVTSASLDRELQAAIVERAGGNPLYAEELVRFATDRGLGGVEVLPDSVQALIAARLDTLTPERKSLLQDAAVVGKVFWADALAAVGTRDSAEIELALHELTRKELERPARTSSMEGESEYSFWHLLVRDVAYAQIPRAERARRHSAAASWIERKAGGRVEDLAEILAHHYLQALELAQAAGDTDQANELSAMARRFLALAGERALGLDTAQAETRLAHALRLTPANDPQRSSLIVLWADAATQAGRPSEAAELIDRELDFLRTCGETETTALALQLRSRLAFRLGEGRHVALAAEAVTLLERARRAHAPPAPSPASRTRSPSALNVGSSRGRCTAKRIVRGSKQGSDERWLRSDALRGSRPRRMSEVTTPPLSNYGQSSLRSASLRESLRTGPGEPIYSPRWRERAAPQTSSSWDWRRPPLQPQRAPPTRRGSSCESSPTRPVSVRGPTTRATSRAWCEPPSPSVTASSRSGLRTASRFGTRSTNTGAAQSSQSWPSTIANTLRPRASTAKQRKAGNNSATSPSAPTLCSAKHGACSPSTPTPTNRSNRREHSSPPSATNQHAPKPKR
jgi:hypothetical protein